MLVDVQGKLLEFTYSFKRKYVKANISVTSPVNEGRFITELQALRQEHHLSHICKRKFTRQSWNKKPGQPRKMMIEDEKLILRKPLYLNDNNYYFQLY